MFKQVTGQMTLSAALVLCCGSLQGAEELSMLEGMVVSTSQGVLVMKDGDGKQHSFKPDSFTKITFHGKPGKVEDFEMGTPIRVTVGAEQRLLALSTIDDQKLVARDFHNSGNELLVFAGKEDIW
jgi:hypothetical protein